jgi:hypothetical protein
MRAFVQWVLARRYRLILLAIMTAPVLPVVASALTSLDTARRGPMQGLVGAFIGIAGMIILAFLSGTNPAVFTAIAFVTFLSGVGIGLLLKAGTLVLAFQAAVLASFGVVAAISLFATDARTLFEPFIAELVEILRASDATPEQIELVEGRGGMVLLAGAVFSQLMGALLLAYWWFALAAGDRRFGVEFRQLKLGRLLGVLATTVIVLGLVFDTALVQNLSALALLAFVVQGLAVLHAWANAKRWHPGLVAPVYVLLVTPLMVLVILGLSALGLLDNWFDLRARLHSQA